MFRYQRLSVTGFAVLILTSISSACWSGAWVPEVGSGYNKVGVASFNATNTFDENADFGEFTGRNLSYYLEHGIAKNLGVFSSVLFQDLEQIDANGNRLTSTGFGDWEIGLRYQWVTDPIVFSTAITAKLPFLYDEDDDLPRGNGQEDYELRFLLGNSLGRFGYYGAELGYRLRTQEPSDEIRYLLEYGFNATKNLYLRTKLDGIQSVGNADSVPPGSNLSVPPEFDLGKLELTVGWNLQPNRKDGNRWGLEFTYTNDLFGTDTLNGDTFQFGITRVY